MQSGTIITTMKARIIKTGKVCELVDYDNGVYPYMDPETGDLFNSREFVILCR